MSSRSSPLQDALPSDHRGWNRPEAIVSGQSVGQGSASEDDDQLAESRMTWLFLLLLSYASAVTLALVWVLWTGRTFRHAESPAINIRQENVESKPTPSDATPTGNLPLIPLENYTSPGKTIRIGLLEITPLAIVSAPVELVRLVEPGDSRREEADSLMLQLKLTNISGDQAFAPLDRASHSRPEFAAGPFPDCRVGRRDNQALSVGRRQRMGDPRSRLPRAPAGRNGGDLGRQRRGHGRSAGRRNDLASAIADRSLSNRRPGSPVHQG